jgi:hypothetical protein
LESGHRTAPSMFVVLKSGERKVGRVQPVISRRPVGEAGSPSEGQLSGDTGWPCQPGLGCVGLVLIRSSRRAGVVFEYSLFPYGIENNIV